ncbi:MFS transporter [Amycolatopsis taiwanensis]|uniref:MFS transporter n=1 Tax=Amycolatopsis taiwanensis TaxID=342230 RepID=A0A9W6R9C2_9PSEU|nr:MFS transporter [Amycolatopsis taiwanensis]GLY70650.1 MFS transporter [Amycolatopsis taiwanensis]
MRTADAAPTRLRVIFSGRRGWLLFALLFTEFGGAVQSIAYSSVLPIATTDLHGTSLYGATLAAGSFTEILVLAIGPAPFSRLRPVALLGTATTLYVLGSALSVAAVVMPMVLIGTIVRGIAGGMLAGFGLSILGGLFEDRERTRVYGLFAMMWMLPSIVGPAVNAAVTIAWGWRAALAWPAILVIVGRVLIAKQLKLVPWKRSTARRPSPTWAITLLGGLVLATLSPMPNGTAGIVLLAVGCLLASTASLRILRGQVGPERARLGKVMLLYLLCLCYFGGAGVVSLAAITGLGHGIVAGTIAVGAGLLAWSLTGFKPELADRWLPKPQVAGLVLVTLGLFAALLTQTAVGGTPALVVLISGWFVAGAGMGIAYPRFSASAMDDLPSDRILPVATAIAFSETAATAIAGFIGGGTYSLARSLALSPTSALSWAFSLLAVFGVTSIVLYRQLWGEH